MTENRLQKSWMVKSDSIFGNKSLPHIKHLFKPSFKLNQYILLLLCFLKFYDMSKDFEDENECDLVKL